MPRINVFLDKERLRRLRVLRAEWEKPNADVLGRLIDKAYTRNHRDGTQKAGAR